MGYHLTTSDDDRSSRPATKYLVAHRKTHRGPKSCWVLSSKYTDTETGLLYYYGHRFYSTVIGRWVSRDPIGEEGGVNVRSFCANSPVDKIDVNGLCGIYAVAGIPWSKVTSSGEIPIDNEAIIGAEGYFMINGFLCDHCDTIFPVKIAVNVAVTPSAFHGKYTYKTHMPPGNWGGTIGFPVGVSSSPRNEVVAHEWGHADAFFAYFIPCMIRELGGNNCCDGSERRYHEIETSYQYCKFMDTDYLWHSDAWADQGSIMWYSSRGRLIDRGVGALTWQL